MNDDVSFSNENTTFSVEEAEAELNKLSSVIAVRVGTSPEGKIREIHAVASSDHSVKQVVRDIESLLAARFGFRINHNIISVALVDPEKLAKELPDSILALANESAGNLPRLVYEELSATLKRSCVSCKVTVSNGVGGEMFCGEASASFDRRCNAAVLATIDAIHNFLGRKNLFSLADVSEVTASGHRIVLVCISCEQEMPHGFEYLTGSALVKEDLLVSAVKATLSAVNRVLPKIAASKD